MNELTDGILISILEELLKRRYSIKILFYFIFKLMISMGIQITNKECQFHSYFMPLQLIDSFCSIIDSIVLAYLYFWDFRSINRILENNHNERISFSYHNKAYINVMTLLIAMSNRYQILYNIIALSYFALSIYGIYQLIHLQCNYPNEIVPTAIIFIILSLLYFIKQLYLLIRLYTKYQVYKIISVNPQSEDVCCICLQLLSQKVVQLLCKHKFHQICIKEWFRIKSTCPICKREYEIIQSNNINYF